MSVVVSEIESMKAPIEAARGKVVTYGLGLGYYAFMASEKPSVESVTVVEMNPDVISLFEKNILPQFPHKEKIHICNADAFEFIDRQKDGDFDAAFSDFWGGYFDGLALYRRFFPKTVRFKKTKHFYWIESAFADYFFRPVIMKFLMKKGKHISIPMPSLSKEAEMLQNRFEIYLESKEGILASSDDIYRLLSEETLISLMRDFLKKLT